MQDPLRRCLKTTLADQFPLIPDIMVNGLVIVEVKAASGLHSWDEAQLLNYLRASPIEVGLIFNFGPKREFQRRLLTNDRKNL